MKKSEMKIKDLYSLDHTMAKSLLEQFEYPWEALAHIGEYVEKLGESLPKNEPLRIYSRKSDHRSQCSSRQFF